MCYLIAKNIDDVGCVALRTTHGKHLSEFKRLIEQKVGYEKVTLLRSSCATTRRNGWDRATKCSDISEQLSTMSISLLSSCHRPNRNTAEWQQRLHSLISEATRCLWRMSVTAEYIWTMET